MFQQERSSSILSRLLLLCGILVIGFLALNGCVVVSYQHPIAVAKATRPGPLTVRFDGSDSYHPDPYREIVSFKWDVGDGESGEGKVVTHTYDSTGTYQVKLTVTDDVGLTGTDTIQVDLTTSEVTTTDAGTTDANGNYSTVLNQDNITVAVRTVGSGEPVPDAEVSILHTGSQVIIAATKDGYFPGIAIKDLSGTASWTSGERLEPEIAITTVVIVGLALWSAVEFIYEMAIDPPHFYKFDPQAGEVCGIVDINDLLKAGTLALAAKTIIEFTRVSLIVSSQPRVIQLVIKAKEKMAIHGLRNKIITEFIKSFADWMFDDQEFVICFGVPYGIPFGFLYGDDLFEAAQRTVSPIWWENIVPTAKLSADPTTGLAPLEVNFDASESKGAGEIVKYKWDFDGDGTWDQETIGPTATYIYDIPGTYNARVKVVDDYAEEKGVDYPNDTHASTTIGIIVSSPISGFIYVSVSDLPSPGLADIQVGPNGVFLYDPTVLHVKKITGVSPYVVLAANIDNNAGEVKFAATTTTDCITDGNVIEMEVEVVGNIGDSTALTITELDVFRDAHGRDIPYSIHEGRFTIGDPPISEPVIIYALPVPS